MSGKQNIGTWAQLAGVVCAASGAVMVHATSYHVDARPDGGRATDKEGGASAVTVTDLAYFEGRELVPGDAVLLRCGQVFVGPLKLRLRGQGGQGTVRVGSLGDCAEGALPVIKGTRLLGKPKALPSGLSQWAVSSPVTHVTVDGETLPVARWPTLAYKVLPKPPAGKEGELAAVAKLPSLLQLSGRADAEDLDGAQVWVRSQEWTIEHRRATRRTGGEVEFDKSLQYPLRPGVGVYFTGKPWMIGRTPGWSYDSRHGQLTARVPASARTIEAAVDEPLVSINGKGSVMIENLRLTDAGADALAVHLDGSVHVTGVRIERAVSNGMAIAGAAYAHVEGVRIDHTGRDGVFFAEVKRAVVRRNVIKQIGLWGPPQTALAAINAHRTQAATIEDNWVEGTAYIGIRFAGDARIHRNIVMSSCQRLSDCAAIYTWRRNAQHITPVSLVSGNTVIGVDGDTSVKLGVNDWFAGIYLDEYVRGVEVADNVIADAGQGIYLHNAVDNRIFRNQIIASRGKPYVEGIDRQKFLDTEQIGNTASGNVILPGRGAPRLLRGAAAPSSNSVSVVSVGGQMLAVGWADWSDASWMAALPAGCRPAAKGWPLMIAQAGRSTSALLDCAP